MEDSVKILSMNQTFVGDRLLFELRRLKNIVIPQGVQKIGAEIENINIPKSVESIEKEAFCECENLRCVIFE